jgi:hypothetical protein
MLKRGFCNQVENQFSVSIEGAPSQKNHIFKALSAYSDAGMNSKALLNTTNQMSRHMANLCVEYLKSESLAGEWMIDVCKRGTVVLKVAYLWSLDLQCCFHRDVKNMRTHAGPAEEGFISWFFAEWGDDYDS